MLEQKGERVVDRQSFDEMVIVQDEDDPLGENGNLVDQGSQDSLDRRRPRLRSVECTQRTFSDIDLNGL